MKKGDYVVATKYDDGSSSDHFVVGYFRDMTWHGRYNVVDENGKLFRHNGFRRAKVVSKDVGKNLIRVTPEITDKNERVWDYVAHFEFKLKASDLFCPDIFKFKQYLNEVKHIKK